jgi:hypothetical protein
MDSRLIVGLALSVSLAYSAAPAPAAEGGGPATKENLDLPYDAIGDDGDDGVDTIEITFFSDPYEGDAFFFCCDRSGTMNDGAKFARLQREVVKSIGLLTPETQFAVVFFDSQVESIPATGRPLSGTPAEKALATAAVLAARPGYGTCAKPALVATLDFARRSTARRKVIIFLSDGQNTCNGQDPATYGVQILAEVDRRNVERVRIDTIVLQPTSTSGEEFLQALAARNRGTCRRIKF